MGTNRDITSVQKSTICIHKYVFTQTDTIPMIAMERRAHNGCLRYSRYQVFQQSSVSLIVSTQFPHSCQQLLGIFKLCLYFRGRHIRQLRTTHFLYFIHIFQLPAGESDGTESHRRKRSASASSCAKPWSYALWHVSCCSCAAYGRPNRRMRKRMRRPRPVPAPS